MLEEKDLTFFNLTYTRLLKRMDESKKLYATILSKPLNFNENETLDVNYEKIPFAASPSELELRWEKQLKYAILSTITDKEDLEKEKKEKDANYVVKSFETLETEARKSTKENLDNIEKTTSNENKIIPVEKPSTSAKLEKFSSNVEKTSENHEKVKKIKGGMNSQRTYFN